MNSSRYNLLRMLHFLFGLLPSFLSIFLPRDKNTIIFNSQFNNTFEHNSRALFIYALENEKELLVKYVINDDEERTKLTEQYGDYFITNHKVKDVMKILSSDLWICSSLETPISGVGLNIRRTVVHLGHGAPLKAIGLGEKYLNPIKLIYYRLIRTNFSYFMSSSQVFDAAWKSCIGLSDFQVVRCSQARCDQISSPDISHWETFLDKQAYNVLYAPTWRPYADTMLFPFDDFNLDSLCAFLGDKNINIYLRLHPNFESMIDGKLLRCKRIIILSSKDVSDINSILGGFDLLITDYSSIYVDFLLTEKPVMFLPYDYEEYKNIVGFSIDYGNFTPGPKPTSLEKFTKELDKLINCPEYYSTSRKHVNNILNPTMSNHAKKNLKLLKKLAKRQ